MGCRRSRRLSRSTPTAFSRFPPRTRALARPRKSPSPTTRAVSRRRRSTAWCRRPRSTRKRTKVKEKIDAKNSLESYIYNIKNTINDEDKIKDKLSDEDKETLEEVVKTTTEWIDENASAD